MEKDVRTQLEKEIHESLKILRGPIIERAIQIENYIDIFIASRITNDLTKEDEIICVILATMSMSTKLKIFGYYVTKYAPNFRAQNPTYYDDLCLLNSQRNRIAHHPGSFTEESLEMFANFNKLPLAKVRYEKHAVPESEIFEFQYLSENDINGTIEMMNL